MGSKVFRRCHSSVEILTEKLSVKKSIVIIILVFIIASAFLGYWFISIKEVPKVFFAPFQTAVEQEYRSKYVKEGRKISETDFWNQKIHGISPKEALQQKAKTLYKEYLLLEKEAKNKGKILKSLDFKCVSWQKVEETMSVNRQIIKDAWVTILNQSDVKEYYQHHLENFTEQAMIKGKISFWKNALRFGVRSWKFHLRIFVTRQSCIQNWRRNWKQFRKMSSIIGKKIMDIIIFYVLNVQKVKYWSLMMLLRRLQAS